MGRESAAASRDAARGLERILLDALAAAGKDVDRLVPDDLVEIDEFHIGGRAATVSFMARLGLREGMSVVDLGSGLGGPARHVASSHACRVTGIDLIPGHVQAAMALAHRVGLAGSVAFVCGSAADTPFGSARFDAAYMLHVGMYVADKPALFAETRRLLKPGGVFGLYDVMRTGSGDLAFPLPWAADAMDSHIVAPGEYRRRFEAAGFTLVHERDCREEGLRFFRESSARTVAGKPPPLGLHLVMGRDAEAKSRNMLAALLRGVAAPIEMIGRLPEA